MMIGKFSRSLYVGSKMEYLSEAIVFANCCFVFRINRVRSVKTQNVLSSYKNIVNVEHSVVLERFVSC